MSRLNCLNGMWGLVSCPFLSSTCAYQRAEVGEGGVGVLRWPEFSSQNSAKMMGKVSEVQCCIAVLSIWSNQTYLQS